MENEQSRWVKQSFGQLVDRLSEKERCILDTFGGRLYMAQQEDFFPEENYFQIEQLDSFPKDIRREIVSAAMHADISGYARPQLIRYQQTVESI